jgi:hypothetical protein
MADDNIRRFPVEKVDRVIKLSQALVNVMQLAETDTPEDLLASLLLVQTALQQSIVRDKGPAELQRVLIAANERRRRYDVVWSRK